MYEHRIRIHYPLSKGRICLRTELNWNQDLEAILAPTTDSIHHFKLSSPRPSLSFKPVLYPSQGPMVWSQGANRLLLYSPTSAQDFYPYFYSPSRGKVTELLQCPTQHLSRPLRFRLYLPPGYEENLLRKYRMVFAHDGTNLFFPEESCCGMEWELDENLDRLGAMNLINQTLLVGIYANNREQDYSLPGCVAYGRAIVEDLLPMISAQYRVLNESRYRATIGSSLGGVVSFYLGWHYPEVFGNIACLSSSFGYQDDLYQHVLRDPLEPRKQLRIYLDSGWPNDNYDTTLAMAALLQDRGMSFGRNLWHFAFPLAKHNEASWAARIHLPLQLFASELRLAAEQRELQAQTHPTIPGLL